MTHTDTTAASVFDSSAWHATCLNILKGSAGGGTEHTYMSNISFGICGAVDALLEEHRADALAIAKDELKYMTHDEIKAWEKESLAQGLCKHGLSFNHCPSGCGG